MRNRLSRLVGIGVLGSLALTAGCSNYVRYSVTQPKVRQPKKDLADKKCYRLIKYLKEGRISEEEFKDAYRKRLEEGEIDAKMTKDFARTLGLEI